jgi:hypothetical protein
MEWNRFLRDIPYIPYLGVLWEEMEGLQGKPIPFHSSICVLPKSGQNDQFPSLIEEKLCFILLFYPHLFKT